MSSGQLVSIGASETEIGHYWFLGAAGAQTVAGMFVDASGDRTGNSFSLTINQGNGTNQPLNFASVSGGIPTKEVVAANGSPLTITLISNASPIVVATSTNHNMTNGQQVQISGIVLDPSAGPVNSAAIGQFYIKNLSTTTFSLYSDPTLLTPVAGNGVYHGGGVAIALGAVTHKAVGAIVRFSGTTYVDLSEIPSPDFAVNFANYFQYGTSDNNVPLGKVNTV